MKNAIIDAIDRARSGEISTDDLIKIAKRNSVDVEDMANLYVMDSDEEEELFARIAGGDEDAKATMLDRHMCLVTSIALDYTDSDKSYLELVDLGIEGLKVALGRYDKRVGYAFAVHAVWWIRQTIVRGIR